LLSWARGLDHGATIPFAKRPQPSPPLEARPKRFSVTEIETLRRDPYAVYAKRILKLQPLDPLLRDPGAAERGSLFHLILHRFTESGTHPEASDATEKLLAIGHECFAEAALPNDVAAVWWRRFEAMAKRIIEWELSDRSDVAHRHSELLAEPTEVEQTGVMLSGRADRIDVLAGGRADIIDYKTGSSPTKAQAYTLLAPQLALEGALLRRGAFNDLGSRHLSDLSYVRLKANGRVVEESILDYKNQARSADDISEEAWRRLHSLTEHYNDPARGYLSRALPFREGDTDGDYDHLARVLEWSAGGEDADIIE
jgi:ATP-dependent helicase/nuclease subunit B